MPSFAWHMHQGFTHTILLALSIAMTFFYILRIVQNSNVSSFLMLGIAIAIGLMSKYSYIIFLFILVFAISAEKSFRNIFFQKEIVITFFFILLLISPHYLWLIENFSDISSQANDRLGLTTTSSNIYFATLFIKIFPSFIGFLFPFILIPIIFIYYQRHSKNNLDMELLSKFNFIKKFFLIVLLCSLILPMMIEIREVKVRWLHPILMLFPFLVFLKIESIWASVDKRRLTRYFIALVIIFSLLVLGIRLIQLNGPKFGYYGRVNVPIHEALRKIPREIIKKSSIVYSNDYFLGPHLFSVFPKEKVYISGLDDKVLNNLKTCLVVWDNDGYDDDKTQSLSDGVINIQKGDFSYKLYYRTSNKKDCS